ncbi:MAG TPA: hypothetical protein VGO09_02680 [Flavisolibacter sp.]|nr:hypothetical protein [Flavisolibacter sp.]
MKPALILGIFMFSGLLFSCSKKASVVAESINPSNKIVTVQPGLDYYLDQNHGKSIWQVFLQFDQPITQTSGTATIEFATFNSGKYKKKEVILINWSIPSSTNATNYIFTSSWTTKDFDKADSVILKDIHSNNSNYTFKIK